MVVSLQDITSLKYPEDKAEIARLDILALQVWYGTQDPREMIFLGQTPEFRRFWFRNYILPVRFKRFVLKVKRMFSLRIPD